MILVKISKLICSSTKHDFLTREREGRFRVAIFGIVGQIDLELDVIPEIGQIYLRTFLNPEHMFLLQILIEMMKEMASMRI